VWLVGAAIFTCLIFFPALGVTLFWNILIPIAPALIVVAVGVWRNVCPLATTALLPRHLGLSRRKIMSSSLRSALGLISIIALYAIVPLRHSIFNLSGHATALLLAGAAAVGVTMGLVFEWKSAWCSSLCPIHPVEKLYGTNTMFALPNAHCDHCMKCVSPCPDSRANVSPLTYHRTFYDNLSALLIVGGLPGFIWGWFHVPDNGSDLSWATVFEIYKMPLAGMTLTLTVYSMITMVLNDKLTRLISSIFAAAAVSCYYWYRIPALLGFGEFGTDGLLVNLSAHIPFEAVTLIIALTTCFFFWWIVIRKENRTSWVIRPAYGKRTV
jgi:ferredoxin